jgi:hypothetical protein
MAQYGLLSAEEAVSQGLGGAAGLIGSANQNPYPAYVPSQTKAPTTQGYMSYTPNQPMQTVQTPNYKLNSAAPTWQNFTPQTSQVNQNYQGLMNGDYAALQQALQQPGEIAARRAYETGQTNLTNQMGGRGLYGSSIMANQARTSLDQPYMDTLASNAANAATQRYGMQATDLQNQNQFGMQQALANQSDAQNVRGLMSSQNLAQNAFGQETYGKQLGQENAINAFNMDNAKLGMTQNQNVYNAGVSDAARQQEYGLAAQTDARTQAEQLRQWENQQALEKFQYDLATQNYNDAQRQQRINEYLALAGRGQITAGQNQQTANINTQADSASQASLYSGLLGALGLGAGIYASK